MKNIINHIIFYIISLVFKWVFAAGWIGGGFLGEKNRPRGVFISEVGRTMVWK
jgi:hypothetical protein